LATPRADQYVVAAGGCDRSRHDQLRRHCARHAGGGARGSAAGCAERAAEPVDDGHSLIEDGATPVGAVPIFDRNGAQERTTALPLKTNTYLATSEALA